nr:GTP cyclohydrolase II [Roseovarius aestuariivivens]
MLARLTNDMAVGLPVVLQGAQGAVLVALIETLTENRLAALMALGRAELVLTEGRARALGIEAEVAGQKVLRVDLPESFGLGQLKAAAGQGADAAAQPEEMRQAGPAAQLHEAAVALAKSAEMLPALLLVRPDPLQAEAGDLGLSAMKAKDVLDCLAHERRLSNVSSAPLPMAVSDLGQVHVFRTDNRREEHYAIEFGTPDPAQPVTVRLHSACFTGDVLASQKCDCGPQLNGAMRAMAQTGGILLYLNQEGRGIGLANKMRAYRLQDAGLDTVEANHWLGFDDDERDFRLGARMLHRLGIRRVRLMTNNPAKIAILSSQGIEVVERVPLHTPQTSCNARYLATKAAKSGHLMP